MDKANKPLHTNHDDTQEEGGTSSENSGEDNGSHQHEEEEAEEEEEEEGASNDNDKEGTELTLGVLEVAESSVSRTVDKKEMEKKSNTQPNANRVTPLSPSCWRAPSSGLQPVSPPQRNAGSRRMADRRNVEEEKSEISTVVDGDAAAMDVSVLDNTVLGDSSDRDEKSNSNNAYADVEKGEGNSDREVARIPKDPEGRSCQLNNGNMHSQARQGVGAQDEDWTSDINPLPLSRQTTPARRPQSSPGAFAVSPSFHAAADDLSVSTIQITSEPPSESVTAPPRPDNTHLIHATLVEDGDAVNAVTCRDMITERSARTVMTSSDEEEPPNSFTLVEAKPMGPPPNAMRSKWTQCNIMLVLGLLSAAITLGVLAAGGKEASLLIDHSGKNNETHVSTIPPTVKPPGAGNEQSENSGIINTVAPSHSSGDETGDIYFPAELDPESIQELFFAALPDYTKDESFKNTSSPQYDAYKWLINDPFLGQYTLDQMLQRFALRTVLNSVGMGHSEMYYGIHECDWNILTLPCNDKQEVTAIWLDNLQLNGTIPLELGMLTALIILDLSQNAIHSSLPTTIGLATSLQVVNLEANFLTGSLPYSLSSLVELEDLNLGTNQFTSTVPPELGFQSNLKWLKLSQNAFTGGIPATLRHLMLETLFLDFNGLTGTLPEVLGELTTLQEMSLSSNQFRGPIPESLSKLVEIQMLNLSFNQLTSTVPTSIGALQNIKTLELQGNNLKGVLPVEICALREWFLLEDITVDCAELECYCFCQCYTEQPND